MNKWFKWLLILFVPVFCTGLLQAYDVVVQLRFYQGFRENGESAGVIVSSYYLEKESKKDSPPYVKVEDETESLKHIYKLKKVKRMASLDVVLKGDRQDNQAHQVKLNGRELWLGLRTIPEKRDRFGIKISEAGKGKKPMLNSEIIVPEGKAAVLGFKDSEEKIYFLAFNRKTEEQSMAEKLGAKSIEAPKLLKIEEPGYPKEALKKEIAGEVVIMGQTDLGGNIAEMEVLKGHPLLAAVSKKALSQWKYAVWKVDGVKKPMDFSMIFIFRLIGKTKESDREILDRCRPLLRSKETKRILPRILELVTISGRIGTGKKEKEKGQSLAERLGAESIKAPILVRRVEPEYPGEALKQKVQGVVILKGVTDLEGNVEKLKVLKGHDLLVKESMEVVRLWKYIPWKIDGAPKPVDFHLVIVFQLDKVSTEKMDQVFKQALEVGEELTEKEKKKKIPTIKEIILVEGE
jgi:outer membrane biosynthesis protein TonB